MAAACVRPVAATKRVVWAARRQEHAAPSHRAAAKHKPGRKKLQRSAELMSSSFGTSWPCIYVAAVLLTDVLFNKFHFSPSLLLFHISTSVKMWMQTLISKTFEILSWAGHGSHYPCEQGSPARYVETMTSLLIKKMNHVKRSDLHTPSYILICTALTALHIPNVYFSFSHPLLIKPDFSMTQVAAILNSSRSRYDTIPFGKMQ